LILLAFQNLETSGEIFGAVEPYSRLGDNLAISEPTNGRPGRYPDRSRNDQQAIRHYMPPLIFLNAVSRGLGPADNADYQVSSITGQPAQLTTYLTD
jgi:hypothetical protein